MNTYLIGNTVSGATLGTFRGETESDALDAMARDAGYKSYADLQAQVPAAEGEIEVRRVTSDGQ